MKRQGGRWTGGETETDEETEGEIETDEETEGEIETDEERDRGRDRD